MTTWDDSRIDKLATQVNTFLNGLPTGVDIQFVQDIEPAALNTLTENSSLCSGGLDSVVEALHKERNAVLRGDIEAGLLPQHSLRLFVRRSMPVGVFKKPSFFKGSQSSTLGKKRI